MGEGAKEEPGSQEGRNNGRRAALERDREKGSGTRRVTRLQGAWLCPWWLFCLLFSMSGWSFYFRMVLLALEPSDSNYLASHTPS